MATKRNPLLKNYVAEDENWRYNTIICADKANRLWTYRWQFLKDEYSALKAKMIEQSAKSHTLKRITEQKNEDIRQLDRYPSSSNHLYGYLASNPAMKLETLGPDHFKPLPIPAIYKIIK